jgi:hypothetical protein
MKQVRVFFYVWSEFDCYQNDVITLAEGLVELGLSIFSDVNYWQRSLKEGDYLIKATPGVKPEDCDVVVVSTWWFHWQRFGFPGVGRRPIPNAVLVPKAKRRYKTVCLDHNDGYLTPGFDPAFSCFDLILRTKFNRRAYHPANMKPWVDALQNRIINYTANAPDFRKRKPAIFVSYNASHNSPHGTRTWALQELHPKLNGILETFQPPHVDIKEPPEDPIEKLFWEQTNGRHSATYFERLKSCQACSAFCGEIMPVLPYFPKDHFIGGNRARLRRMPTQILSYLKPGVPRIFSFDSFRFWETMAAGTVVFHVDLDLYGAVYPVQPQNWKHYIGVNMRDVDATVRRIKEYPNCLERIAAEGRKWALENYSPKAVARRFLNEVENIV